MKRRVLRPTRGELVPALASATLFGLSFPPFPLLVPVFLCLVPLAVAVARAADGDGTGRSAARLGFWFGIVGFGLNLYWIAYALSLYTKLAILGFVAAILWLSLLSAGAVAALFAARRASRYPMAVLLPVVWVGFELALGHLSDLAFPWLPLGLATAQTPILAQVADISGVSTVSLWIALTNGLIVDGWLHRGRLRAVAGRAGAIALAAIVVLGYGAWRMATLPTTAVGPIGIVQPNIPQEEKWQEENRDRIVGLLADQTRELIARDRPALVVWPEVALPGFLAQHPEWRDTLRTLAAPARTPILFGVLDLVYSSAAEYEYYNAAMLADSTGRVLEPAYHKGYLVPVVERVPFLNPEWFGGLRYFGGFGRGRDPVVFPLDIGYASVLICYESIFPPLARSLRIAGADILVNITNDAWFGRTTAPYQHESHLVLRAIENRVGIVRSANTGISEYITPLGERVGATDLFVPAIETYRARTSGATTLYVRFGDWIGVLCLVAATALVTRHGLRIRRRVGQPDPTVPSRGA